MDYLKAEKLRKEWGDKPCSHPSFEVETHLDSEYVAVKTGDYVCTCCGQDFTKEEIKAIEKKFYKQGHSGMSAALAARALSKVILNVLNRDIIHPIYSEEELQFKDAYGMIQSTVMYSVFKEEDGCTYQDAIVFIDQDGNSFRGSAAGINSSQYIKFPFYPKTFYIDVIKKDNDYVLKDKSQMDAVYEYYQKK